jgi:pimeloyl-ACP methyl ester carboxylesterase
MDTELFSLRIKDEYLHGIIHHPIDRSVPRHVVVFLHGYGGYRIGPHRMFVDFSRRLAEVGYTCVRFDFRGWGYSGNIDSSRETRGMIDDIDLVINHIHTSLNPCFLSIAGICFGAKLALYYAKSRTLKLSNLILLSCSPLNQNEKSHTATLAQVQHTIRPYLTKLFQKETWRKFLTGEIRYRKIVKTVLKPLSGFRRQEKYAQPTSSASGFENFTGGVLSIHAEQDPETLIAKPQIEDLLTKNNVTYRSYVIEGANHSFYSIEWKEKIYDFVEKWLTLQNF